jgi:stage II sporulation protein AA (anti-sigma F factor antagonist)
VQHQTTTAGLRCEIEPDRDRVIVRPYGEIDIATVGAVEAPLDELRSSGFQTVVLDLRWVPFMDSTGLRLILRQCQHAEQDGTALRVEVTEGGAVHRLLSLTGVLDVLPVSLSPASPVKRAGQG